jgi:hypothetical protein
MIILADILMARFVNQGDCLASLSAIGVEGSGTHPDSSRTTQLNSTQLVGWPVLFVRRGPLDKYLHPETLFKSHPRATFLTRPDMITA